MRQFEEGGSVAGTPAGRIAAVAALALALTACAVQSVPLEASDPSVLFTDARLAWEIVEGGAREAGEGPRVALELDVSHGAADSEVSLPPGQSVYFDGRSYFGQLDVFYELTRVLVDARASALVTEQLRVEGFGGLEWSAMDVDVRSSGLPSTDQGSERFTALGPAVGLGFCWEPWTRVRLASEVRCSFGFSSDIEAVQLLAFDLGAGVDLLEHLGLYAGWRTVSYEAERSALVGSDLDLRLSGPVLAVRAAF